MGAFSPPHGSGRTAFEEKTVFNSSTLTIAFDLIIKFSPQDFLKKSEILLKELERSQMSHGISSLKKEPN